MVPSTAAVSASRSSGRTCTNPAGSGSNGSFFSRAQVACSVPSVRPWNEFSRQTMRCLSGPPRARPRRRASLIAASFASAPELQKNAPPSSSHSSMSRSASATPGSDQNRLET